MHTALIGDYLVHFRSIGPAAPTASAPRLDLPGVSAAFDAAVEQKKQQRRRDLAARADAADIAWRREVQPRFFRTFGLDVPADADAHPIHASVSSGPGGQCAVALYTGGGECSALSAGELCEIAYEGPPPDWVRELVGKYGGKMVFDAVREYAVAANGGDRIDGVLERHGVARAAVRFGEAPPVPFGYGLAVHGTVVEVFENRVGPVRNPERLAPWTAALLARADAHEILCEIVKVVYEYPRRQPAPHMAHVWQ